MVHNPYELIKELPCADLYLLKDKEHFQTAKIKQMLLEKCLLRQADNDGEKR